MDVGAVVEAIKRRLGGDVLRLEIPDSTIESFVNDAFNTIKPHINSKDFITLPSARSIDLAPYKVEEVIRLYPANVMSGFGSVNELMFDFQLYRIGTDRDSIIKRLTNMNNLEDYEIPYRFDQEKKSLQITFGEAYPGGVTAEVIREVFIEELRDERAQTWIVDYALALCKEAIGRIRSKYTDTSVPFQMDGKELVQEGKEDQVRLLAQLKDDAFGPFIVLR